MNSSFGEDGNNKRAKLTAPGTGQNLVIGADGEISYGHNTGKEGVNGEGSECSGRIYTSSILFIYVLKGTPLQQVK